MSTTENDPSDILTLDQLEEDVTEITIDPAEEEDLDHETGGTMEEEEGNTEEEQDERTLSDSEPLTTMDEDAIFPSSSQDIVKINGKTHTYDAQSSS